MASPDPIVEERQYYLDKLGLVDDPNISIADLRSMTGGGASVHRAAKSSDSQVAQASAAAASTAAQKAAALVGAPADSAIAAALGSDASLTYAALIAAIKRDLTVKTRTNLMPNPQFKTVGGTLEMRRNTISNPSFEVDTVGWVPGGPVTATRDTTKSSKGAASVKLTRTGAGPISYASNTVAAAPGDVWTVSLDSATSSGALAGGSYLSFLNNVGTPILDTFLLIPAGTAFGRQTVTATAPAGTASVVWQFYTSNGVNGDSWWLDGVLLEKTDKPLTYFDGSTVDTPDIDYQWLGPAHNSASILVGAVPASSLAINNYGYKNTIGGKTVLTSSTSPYLYGGGTGVLGRYYAATLKVYGNPGQGYNVSSSDNVVGAFTDSVAGVIPAGGVATVDLTSTVAVSGVNIFVGLTANAQEMSITDVIIEEVSGPGLKTGGFFHGGQQDADGVQYRWAGAVDNSTSTRTDFGRVRGNLASSGTTANRPDGGTVPVGFTYYDTSLSKPVWWNGVVWRDATGAAV